MTTSTLATLTIGGEPQPGAASSYPVHNPARPAEIVGEAPAADRAQLDAAVTCGAEAAPAWRALDVGERVAKVAAAATTAGMQLKERDGARLYTSEHGKVLSEADFELDTAPMVAAVLGSMAEAALAPEQIDPQAPYPRLHREPYGVAALVIPFNWPLAVMMTKLTSALSGGQHSGGQAAADGSAGRAAVRRGVRRGAATGRGGRAVGAGRRAGAGAGDASGHRRHLVDRWRGDRPRGDGGAGATRLTPVLLELGGNDAAIIAPDMPISDRLVEQLVAATYTTGGQVCMAIKRLYAPRDRSQRIVGGGAGALRARSRRRRTGGRNNARTAAHRGWAGQGEAATGRCCCTRGDGADRGTDPRARTPTRCGYFVLPTRRNRCGARFGVVERGAVRSGAADLRLRRHRRAVAAANATEFGLTASVWTGDDALADKVTRQLVAGTVSVNCHGMAAQDPRVPFGGVGQSGLGRELGPDGIRAFTQPRGYVRRPPPQ